MDVKVVDASAVAALLFGEPEAESIAGRLTDARLVAPALLAFELADICRTKGLRQPQQRPALRAALALRRRLAVVEVRVDHEAALDLATLEGLTAYDASYLWLVRHIGAELVTLDPHPAKAAR
jgi:predicted nucleic acid-binding protein